MTQSKKANNSVGIEVRDLRVRVPSMGRDAAIIDGVSFTLAPGCILGIVGESGSGKSTIADAILGLLAPGLVVSGTATFGTVNLVGLSEGEMRKFRGGQISLIGQDPLESLNPVHRIGKQIVEVIRLHEQVNRADAKLRTIELLQRCGLTGTAVFSAYPHELSGGMRQRVAIAMALAAQPNLIIADEPTTALDNTVQAQILTLLRKLTDETGVSVIFITHDLGVVDEIADEVAVLYAGSIVEHGPTREVISRPRHPYTKGLLAARPRVNQVAVLRLEAIPGSVPTPGETLSGCRFAPRCKWSTEICSEEPALIVRSAADHPDRCWHSPELAGEWTI